MLTLDQIVEKIMADAGISRDDTLTKIREMQQELHGFVTLEGAASIVASRLGVSLKGAIVNFTPAEPSRSTKDGGNTMDEFEDMRKDLEQQALRGEKWAPEEGDVLLGVVVRKDNPIVGRNEDDSEKRNELIVVKDESDALWTVWKSKALEDLFAEVNEGDKVGLKYIGTKKNIKGPGTFKKIEWVLRPAAPRESG